MLIKLLIGFLVWGGAHMIVEGIWFMPKVFGERWRLLSGYTPEQYQEILAREKKAMPLIIIGAAAIYFGTATLFSLIGSITVMGGAMLAGLIAIAYMGAKNVVDLSIAGKPMALWFINMGYVFADFLIMGALLGAAL